MVATTRIKMPKNDKKKQWSYLKNKDMIHDKKNEHKIVKYIHR